MAKLPSPYATVLLSGTSNGIALIDIKPMERASVARLTARWLIGTGSVLRRSDKVVLANGSTALRHPNGNIPSLFAALRRNGDGHRRV